MSAGRAQAGSEAAADLQEATGYPGAPTEPAYNPPSDASSPSPGPSPTLIGPVQSSGTPSATVAGFVTPTPNPLTPSPTAGRDLFGTEDSEIGSSRVTPPPSETPRPLGTATLPPSLTPTSGGLQGFSLNRGLFAIGFLLPVGLFLLGLIGYRLLRSPEFSTKK